MAGAMETTPPVENPGFSLSHQKADLGFSVLHQRVALDIDPALRKLRGTTEITIAPHSTDLKTIRLHCRQCNIKRLSLNGRPCASMGYLDPYKRRKLNWQTDIHQYHMLQDRLEGQLKVPPAEPELIVTLSKSTKIQELDQPIALDQLLKMTGADQNMVDSSQNAKSQIDQTTRFTPIIMSIEFTIDEIRDGLQFTGWNQGDLQYPHAFSRNSLPGTACCLFPCLDAVDSLSTWEVSVTCPRTIGDAFRSSHTSQATTDRGGFNGTRSQDIEAGSVQNFTVEEQALDLKVVCSGDLTDEIVDTHDPTKKTTTFSCVTPVAPQHIGFAIGPFEHVNLAAFRESEEDDKLGQNAIPVHGFCLPGRVEEVKNTCLPIAKAIDHFTMTYGSYPFSIYKMCFVDDLVMDCVDTATLTIFGTRILFPEDIIDPIDRVTRRLVYAVASQWLGVNIIPKEPADAWAIVGMGYFITDKFMRSIAGNNEYRYQQKKASDRVCELDVARPSIYDTGKLLWLEPSQADFLALKAPLVLFILDRRLVKASGSSGLARIISRVFLNAKTGDLENGALTTAYFQKTCEKTGHAKLDTFFAQWVYGAGCPLFRVTQRFNKKRLVVEMMIQQVQADRPLADTLNADTFMRDVKEDLRGVFAGPVQPAFMGPMTIRIHEADGTPYEHIIEIKEGMTRFDIPYNTKYKRLKRSRRHKERNVGTTIDFTAEAQDDVLLYCLGDVLQTEEEIQEWKLTEWSKEDEDKMSQESYEWIRMDADFEWISKMHMNQPGYMYLSQLQQDRDVVAQLESVQFMAAQREHPLVSTILIRTLMDRRYFHGIRTTAAAALVKHAKEEIGWLGMFHLEKAFQHFFCLPNSKMTRSNDFSDRASYYIQCAIPQAMAKIRDSNGKTPFEVRRFLYEKLRYNDNSNNEVSDAHYLATLMNSLTDAISSTGTTTEETFSFDPDPDNGDNSQFYMSCVEEIDRYRRLDEWIPSYQNILSSSALDCRHRLMKTGGIPVKTADYLTYTQDGCHDSLRLTAFRCLMDLGLYRNYHILRWFLFVLSTDPSAYLREHMIRLLGKTLGSIAMGEFETKAKDQDPMDAGGLIVEEESSTEARQADLARKQTIPGALAALKAELEHNEVLKTSLWQAIKSPTLTIREIGELLQICSLIYEPVTSCRVVLKYPRYWGCRNEGRSIISTTGKPSQMITFFKTDKIRTTFTPLVMPPPPIVPPPVPAEAVKAPVNPLVLKRAVSSNNCIDRLTLKPPKKPDIPRSLPAGDAPSPAMLSEAPKKLTIKFNVNPRRD